MSNMRDAPVLKAVAEVVKDHVGKAFAALRGRIDGIEQRFNELPKPAVGPQGSQGPIGEKGADGAPGIQGGVGPAGKDGAAGRDGIDGKNGIDGAVGANGKDGNDGINGKDGERGPEGKKGIDGKDGQQGIPGIEGAAGKDGNHGREGKDGRDGIDGKNGVDGISGKDGNNGKDGADGIAGKDGRDGIDGKSGSDGINGKDGRDGLVGPQGPIGKKGDEGMAGRDAAEIDYIDGIDESASYPRGVYALHRNGTFKAYRTTNPVVDGDYRSAGWQCLQASIFDIVETLAPDQRTVVKTYEFSDGTVKTTTYKTAAMIHRGTHKDGETYEAGDCTTVRGSTFKANKTTTDRPGTSDAWTLIVKRGDRGKDLREKEDQSTSLNRGSVYLSASA